MKRIFLLLVLSGIFTLSLRAQKGKDGALTVSAANTTVNAYTTLTADVNPNATSITVASTASFAAGDLIMIIQMQGATINTNIGWWNPTDSTYGEVLFYRSCGNYQLAQINAVPNGTTLNLDCAVQDTYKVAGKTQIVKIPRYTALTINSGGVLTCPTWNGTTGGVLAVEVDGNIVVNSGGLIDATGKGFRGGARHQAATGSFGIDNVVVSNPNHGAEKGEGIAGSQADYDVIWTPSGASGAGRYGRGAPANGGGGGLANNSGGGGGANGGFIPGGWNGYGIVDHGPANAYDQYWNLEASPSRANIVSTGGGRGGYKFSSANQNVTLAPGNSAWSGDYRRNLCGFGGRPLDYSTGKIFMGGGGGAGEDNDGYGGKGGNGGGIIFMVGYGTLSGNGIIRSNGAKGDSTKATGPNNDYYGRDGAGGAGGGGTILVKCNTITASNFEAKGGNGGNVNIYKGSLYFNTINDGYGPGGGGGGGYVSLSGGSAAPDVSGGNNGIQLGTHGNSSIRNNFPPNGATRGAAGTANNTLPHFYLTASNYTVCTGNTATLSVTVNGTAPNPLTINWYTNAVGGAPVGTGTSFTTPVLSVPGTVTYYAGTCPGWNRIPITITVSNAPNAPNATANSPICAGQTLNLNSTTTGVTYNWTGPNGFSSTAQNPTIPSAGTNASGTYSLVVSVGSCSSPVTTVAVTVNAVPNAPIVSANGPICAGQTINLGTTATGVTYNWTGPNSFSSNNQNPTIPSAGTAASGTYSLTVSNGNCTSTTSTVAVVVNSVPNAPQVSAASPLCSGQTLNLTTTATGVTYNWTGPNSFSSSSQNPSIPSVGTNASGTYSLTVSNGNCTSTTSTVAVVVNQTPATPSASANSPICEGQALNLSTTATGVTYNWTGPNSFSSSNQNPGIGAAGTNASGTYSLTVSANGCNSAQTTVSVVVNPVPTAVNTTTVSASCGQSNGSLTINSVTGGSPAYQYNFNGAGFSSTTNYPNLAAGSYPLIIQDQNNCTYTTSINISSSGGPTAVSTSTTTASCGNANGSVTISNVTGGTGPYQYNFDNGGLTSSTTFNNVAAGTYPLLVQDASGCVFSTNVTIPGTPAITDIDSVITDATCSQNNGSVTITAVNGGTGPFQYNFNGAGNSANNSYSNLAAGTYPVVITDNNNCSYSTNVIINNTGGITNAATALSSDTCGQNSGQITVTNVTGGTAPYQYALNSGTPQASQVFTGLAGGTYTIQISDASGCIFSTTVTINSIGGPPVPTVSASGNLVFCQGGSVTLASSSSTGNVWSTGATTNTITVTTSGTYSVTVTQGGCSSVSLPVNVTVNPVPTAPAVVSPVVYCQNQNAVPLTATSSGGSTLNWYTTIGGTPLSGAPVPSTSAAGTTTYYVSQTQNGCESSTNPVNVIVNPSPSAAFTFSPGPIIQAGTTVNFISSAAAGSNYLWNFGDPTSSTNTSTIDLPNHTYNLPGTFCASLIVTNSLNSCPDTFQICLEVITEEIIEIPNVFSPTNGDNINDVFSIKTQGYVDLNCQIFDRWGLKVGSFSGINGYWDGNTLSGKKASEGVYYYVIDAKNYKGVSKQFAGHLQLMQ